MESDEHRVGQTAAESQRVETKDPSSPSSTAFEIGMNSFITVEPENLDVHEVFLQHRAKRVGPEQVHVERVLEIRWFVGSEDEQKTVIGENSCRFDYVRFGIYEVFDDVARAHDSHRTTGERKSGSITTHSLDSDPIGHVGGGHVVVEPENESAGCEQPTRLVTDTTADVDHRSIIQSRKNFPVARIVKREKRTGCAVLQWPFARLFHRFETKHWPSTIGDMKRLFVLAALIGLVAFATKKLQSS